VILSRKGFNTILDKHPKVGIKILKGIARLLSLNMRRTSSHLADYIVPVDSGS
jgi:CRP-like cAMP-binding protein